MDYYVLIIDIKHILNETAESIPSSVKSLTLVDCFVQVLSAESIPSSIKSLTFGNHFNQVLSEGIIPSSVKLFKTINEND
ncbi:hypothetical protein RB653_009851 [Dictyostelium firmibasis]|uniref:Uncharacterized protein n=1 Tax=Dictyostelium firmibasis TaxID=79012 RepID=A0AAN7TT39_9MYCE